MNELGYDKTSIQSILNYARKLTGHSLEEIVLDLPQDIANHRNRGDLGSLIEKFFFKHTPPNTHEPDFPLADGVGLELKVTGVKKSNNQYRTKERLVLTMIDFQNIINENWKESILLRKCRMMLILFYLYNKEIPVHKRKFVIDPLLYNLLANDEKIIRDDWEFIRHKIDQGKAHELSEGDTLYLGACRKGAGGDKEKLRVQPRSEIKAKARAFSFKPEYLNSLLEAHLTSNLSTIDIQQDETFEQATLKRFDSFIGKSVDEIAQSIGYLKKNSSHKSYEAELAKRVISGKKDDSPQELDKAGILVKTIRLHEGKLKESLSFPHFKYMEFINEEWEDSVFFEYVERKFLFVVLDSDQTGKMFLKKVLYWNMPYEDRLEAEKVWKKTKSQVLIDASILPKESENRVAHVRPHARNKNDTLPTPQGTYLVKKSFWLNRSYIQDVINSF